jgi:predicted nucleic acid-binding protein
VLEEAIDGRIELILPDLVLDELERVLNVKLGFDAERIRTTCQLLEGLAADRPGRPEVIESLTGDPADDIVLAAAIEAHVDLLVTGERRHLLPIQENQGVRIVTPQALLAELRDPRR